MHNYILYIEKVTSSAKWKVSEIIHSSELRNKDRLTSKKLLKGNINASCLHDLMYYKGVSRIIH